MADSKTPTRPKRAAKKGKAAGAKKPLKIRPAIHPVPLPSRIYENSPRSLCFDLGDEDYSWARFDFRDEGVFIDSASLGPTEACLTREHALMLASRLLAWASTPVTHLRSKP